MCIRDRAQKAWEHWICLLYHLDVYKRQGPKGLGALDLSLIPSRCV
ncbi:hypothetical protein [Burkholderia plantarii]|nr:hypothetical protein [Burkholderia plantarii]